MKDIFQENQDHPDYEKSANIVEGNFTVCVTLHRGKKRTGFYITNLYDEAYQIAEAWLDSADGVQ